jgi:transposase-like protein
MLQELSVVEQRYLAVREVLDGAKVTDVATRYGVDRRTVHRWLVRYRSIPASTHPENLVLLAVGQRARDRVLNRHRREAHTVCSSSRRRAHAPS